jgi:phage/plasmid primase-like uncharacterized protein
MNKAQKEARAHNEAVLARNFPGVDAKKLQNDLYKLALACEHNAVELCNTANHVDTRDELRDRLKAIAEKHGIDLKGRVTGDPRGYCLKLHLPNEDHNTWGGKEEGYGIGSN